jgi:DMSO/TMAO reductase YedYZ molybdopterin-dependent catalytic subunit
MNEDHGATSSLSSSTDTNEYLDGDAPISAAINDSSVLKNHERETTTSEKNIADPLPVEAIEQVDADASSPVASSPVDSSPDDSSSVKPGGPTADELLKDFRRRSRRSFLVFGGTSLAGVFGFNWLRSSAQNDEAPWLLRNALNASAAAQRGLFGDSSNVPTFSPADARAIRINGDDGLEKMDINADTWLIEVRRNGVRVGDLRLADLKTLPRFTQTVEHKCIEGWSETVTWSGARMLDVLNAAEELSERKGSQHIGFLTPNEKYYVSLERSAVEHPQTLLAFSLNGKGLSPLHGAPCRIAIPTRYGIKSLKRVGVINLCDDRTLDYWAERGYDNYAAF